MELGVLGPLQVRQRGVPVVIPGAKPRALLTVLGLHHGSVVPADTLIELLWGTDPPRTAAKALQTHISALRRTLGDGFVLTEGLGWKLAGADVDASRYRATARAGRDAAAAGDTSQAVARFEEALSLWRGIPELPDGRRGTSEKTRWIEGHAALVEDRADALLATGRAAEIIGDLEAAVAEAPLRERRWGQLMLALYRAGRQGEALAAYQRARSMLADELGVDPGPELRRLEAAIVAQDSSLDVVVVQLLPSVTRAVTFLLTDIEGSTSAWELDADAMAVALARHDEIIEQVVTARGGRLIKTRGEGDATFSVFDRPSAAAAAAIDLQEAIFSEPWALREPMRVRVALHTGEVEFRDGDYFGRAVNRAARLRSLAAGGQILCSGAVAELVIDTLSDDVVLADLGTRHLKNLARPEHVFELRLDTERHEDVNLEAPTLERPPLPAVLIGPGPFVGRGPELQRLLSSWQSGGTHAVLIAGEPGVGKTRLAGEWSQRAYKQGAFVLYGRCDEDLGAPYQPFAEALRSLVPSVGADRLRGLRGVEALLPLVPGLPDVVPDLASPARSGPDTERYALFDAVVALLEVASAAAPVILVLDDLHWAAKPTLLLLRHLLRFGDRARVQIVGTYRSTDLDRSHPLAAMLADLHRDGSANRLNLSGLDQDDVTAYVAEAGYDEELAHALASVTGGNPFFLIEALRHVDESGGVWDQSTLPQGVREAVSRRLSRLSLETNKALSAAAVVGSRFGLELVETVIGTDLVDAFDEACQAGLVIEEPGGRYRFNHAIVRQSLLAELASVRRMRLHQRIASTLENQPGADDQLLAELAHHYFECAWAGNASKAVSFCRRAADQAMARLAYEGAADLYDHALHALQEIDDELPDRDEQTAELLVARCEALLAAGDMGAATGAVTQLHSAAVDSLHLTAWATCFDGQLSMLIHPERLDEVEAALGVAAARLAELDDAAGEAKAHTVRAGCLARLGRIGDCEVALDDALTAARRSRDHRRVNAVLAGAPLAALWGPNPVPRAGGRCLDVVRLLRITTDSPAVEATSTRCQAVLEAFRGRTAAGRRMIDSARRTVTELGLRHSLLEVEQFAGIVELVAADPSMAEPHLRKAYNGFRRMGLDADTAETAALLGRACLLLDREEEASELCAESERLAGHALKASIAWRLLRAHLLTRSSDYDEARQVAEAAVSLAERTDLLVDHGDACLTLATVLRAGGDAAAARAAASRAVDLYERKGAAALAEMAQSTLAAERRLVLAAPDEARVELDNACVRASGQVAAAVDREAWDELARLFAPQVIVESRRKLVRFNRDDLPTAPWPQQVRRLGESGALRFQTVGVLAVRGEHLALTRLKVGTADKSVGSPHDEFLQLCRLDADGRIALQIWFDLDDVDVAIAELDAAHERSGKVQEASVELHNACVQVIRHGEAAIHRKAWDEYERLISPDVIAESRRKVVGFKQNDLPDEWLDQASQLLRSGTARLASIIVLATRGEHLALVRAVLGTDDESPGAPSDEYLHLIAIDDQGRISRQVFFDAEDIDSALAELDAAYARFAKSRPQTPLENTASRADARFNDLFAGRCWNEFDALLIDDLRIEDRRQGLHQDGRGRAAALAELRAIAGVGTTTMTSHVVAVRGERLALVRTKYSGRDTRPPGFDTEVLRIAEIDTEGRMLAYVALDADDLDAAFEELDRRYLAGEGAAHAHTWSVLVQSFAAFNRHELPSVTPDWVNVDHRRARAFAPGDLVPYIRATWELAPEATIYVVAVHRLSGLGAVVTQATCGTSRAGFDVEWLEVTLFTVEGGRISRCEVFEEADLNAAIARFDELTQPLPRLQNAASRVDQRVLAYLSAGDLAATAGLLSDGYCSDDRRQVVGVGTIRGLATASGNAASAELGVTFEVLEVIATRGDRLALSRIRCSRTDQRNGPLDTEMLSLVEANPDEHLRARIMFDPNDVDTAFAELDARYRAGEAAPYLDTWSSINQGFAALNRRELFASEPDWVNIDHRKGTSIATGEMPALLDAAWRVPSELTYRIVAVPRLNEHGAVLTHVTRETSDEGFLAEWRVISVITFDGELVDRCEIFDEADLDAAIARFDELHLPAKRLQNKASRVGARSFGHFAAGEIDAVAEIMAAGCHIEDRRKLVSVGSWDGHDAVMANMRALSDGATNRTLTVIATRGERLALFRVSAPNRDAGQGQFGVEVLSITVIDADERITAHVLFEPDDFDAAFAELDARYLAGEAPAAARTWSMIAGAYAGFKRHDLPAMTSNLVYVDHRPLVSIEGVDLAASIHALWDLMPSSRAYIEAVHRLTEFGAVITQAVTGTSQDGFDAELQMVAVFTVEGDLLARAEVFDETDLDAAIARFEELHAQAQQPQTAACRVAERFIARYAVGDWNAMADMLAEDFLNDDRRQLVGSGIRLGRDAHMADVQALTDLCLTNVTPRVIATRGERLVLARNSLSDSELGPEANLTEVLSILEIASDERIVALITFDVDDLEAAFAELEARYLAGEVAAHARTWSVLTGAYASLNKHEIPLTATDFVDVDHRPLAPVGPGDLRAYLRAALNETTHNNLYVETVHRLTDTGAVVTHVASGTTSMGFEAEWRITVLFMIEGELLSRCEMFDEADLDAALARFDEFDRSPRT
ncbi:BTAD domain-containing putative transcriptional regulator [Mycobacterium vicinigordonae]|uniref:BTAD domain-containing putative transcriptional regulator n=1 Tax=Mycobacterium vicinigordonae TaxID=1719132 RepID=UPI001FEBA66F|nr:BTAD domain-containing putative transcriptional regulator [Mycobacterium vicinigordonae]